MPITTGKLAVGDRLLLLVYDDKDYRMSIDVDEEPPKMAWRMATVTDEIVPLNRSLPRPLHGRSRRWAETNYRGRSQKLALAQTLKVSGTRYHPGTGVSPIDPVPVSEISIAFPHPIKNSKGSRAV